MVASRGRGKDTMLAHITPKEAKMLRAKGGMGTINPATGLPEYGWLDDAWNGVKNTVNDLGNTAKNAWNGLTNGVKDVFNSPIGRVLGTVALAYFAGPAVLSMTGLSGAAGAAATMAAASGAATALGGGNIGDVLKSAAIGGATAFFGAPGGAVSNFVHGAVSNAAANAAITSGIVGTGIGLLSGQKLQDAVKSGLTAGAVSGLTTGVTKGFGAQIEAPKIASVGEMAGSSAAPPSASATNANLPAGAQPVPGATVVENGVTYQKYSMPDGTFTYRPEAGASVNAAPAPATASASAPAATDPLGDFIAKNEAQRALVNTPAQPGQGYQAPTIGGSFRTMGGGIADIAQGDFSKGWESLSKGTGDLLFPGSPTTSDVMGSKSYADLVNKGISPDKALELASKELTPGVLRTYGPATAAGLGIAGLAGAFTPKPSQPTAEEQAMNQRLQAERDRVAANPGNYVPKGLEKYGIKYNDKGEIIGSSPWNPASSMGPTEVAGDYMAYKPSPYMTPTGAIGGGLQPIYQPFNTASMYTNLMPTQYRADGGIASLATGGYPRRTGQISGPGTETSDSIPAMLSDGEFVMTAKAVRGAGKGSRLAGAKKMYALMHQLERNAARG
jgi:hypothetical protein